MALVDDLRAPRPRKRPLLPGVKPPQADAPLEVGYSGPPTPPYVEPRRVPPITPDGFGSGGGDVEVPPAPKVPPVVPPVTPPVTPAPPPVTPPAASGVGPYAVEANQAKLNSEHDSPMYRMLRALSGFDPKKGLKQQGLLEALNGLGLGTFGASDDDELEISGNIDPRWDGVTKWDVIKGFDTGNGVWTGQGLNGRAATDQAAALAAQQAASQGAGGGSSAPGMPGGGGASGAPTPGQNGLALDPVTGQLGGAAGMNFGIDGEYGYDDPNTQKLEEFLRLMIDDKTNPINDPARNEYANALRQRFRSLIAPGSGANAGASALDSQLQQAIAQLTNPEMQANEMSRLENRALEPLERDRQAAIQRETQRLASMGHGEGSGTFIEAIDRINRQFDQRRGEVQRDLSIYDSEQIDSRRKDALGFGKERRDVIGTELDRETGRYGQALTMAEALSNLSGQQRNEQDARMREALTYVSLFPEMDERRLRLAMETLGMSSGMANAPSIFNTLSGLSAQANAANQQGQQSNAAFWSQMGQWMAQNWGAGGGQ
jgi:hypothetical protein